MDQKTTQPAAALAPRIPPAEARELPFTELTPGELGGFFGSFFVDTVQGELA